MVGGAIQRLGDRLTRWSERYLPDPFILALLLTAAAGLLGLWFYHVPIDAGFSQSRQWSRGSRHRAASAAALSVGVLASPATQLERSFLEVTGGH